MTQRDLFTDADSPPVLSVWELTSQIKDLLEISFPAVWVVGEISNLSRPQSGHCYLTLKDDRAANPRGLVAQRRRGRALRPPRRHGSDLPRAIGRLRPARLLSIDSRADRAEGDRGIGAGLAATAGKTRPRGALRSGAEAAAAAIVAPRRPGDQSHRRGDPRFSPGPQAAMAGRRRVGRAHPRPGRRRGGGDRRGD